MKYKDAGVDIEKGSNFIDIIREITKNKEIGSFGGQYKLNNDISLVASTDGVGTKLKIAFMMDKHNTIGKDLVAMSVNDIVCQGAYPLFFLDYLATSKLNLITGKEIIKGIHDGCEEAGCMLLGGETAEMPDMYKDNEYDLSGFAVGIKKYNFYPINYNESPIIGIESSGVHSNGYSLVRKICFEKLGLKVDDYIDEFNDTLGNVLLKPTHIYSKMIMNVFNHFKYCIYGIANITGGGLVDNIKRIIPKFLKVDLQLEYELLPIFKFLQKHGNIDNSEMYKTFNCNIGMVLITNWDMLGEVSSFIEELGFNTYLIGKTKNRRNNEEQIIINNKYKY